MVVTVMDSSLPTMYTITAVVYNFEHADFELCAVQHLSQFGPAFSRQATPIKGDKLDEK